jgi:Mg2+/Co2+ transporter CorB
LDAQVERQRAALEAIDAEAEEESSINRELAHVMCTRLEAARKATEKMLGVLQVRTCKCFVLF